MPAGVARFMGTESRIGEERRARGRGEWRLVFSGVRVSVWKGKKVGEMDGGDGCTAV